MERLEAVRPERAPRIPGAIGCRVHTPQGAAPCRVRDLSLTGLFVSGLRAAVGREVRLELALPEGERLGVVGRVVRCEAGPDGGAALTFARIGWTELLVLARHLAVRI